MLTQIEFIINKEELIKALEFLSPFIVDHEEEYIFSMKKTAPYQIKRFYSNKVAISLYKTHACLSVLTEEGVRVDRTCDVESNVEGVSFCMPHVYLLKEVVKYGADSYSFKEERFFGFIVTDTVSGKYLFDIDAHSISMMPSIHPKIEDGLYTHNVEIESDTLIKVLKEFAKYTDGDSMHPYTEHIWFYINDGYCRVIASSGLELRQEVFPTRASGSHILSLPGIYAGRISDIIVNWSDNTYQQISYTNTYLCFCDIKRNGRYWENIEVPMCKTELPSIQSILENRDITYRSSVHLKDLQSALKMINTKDSMDITRNSVLMHFFPDHVNIFNKGALFEDPVFSFIDAEDAEGERIIKLDCEIFKAILEEIHTDKVLLTLVNDKLLYISSEDESLFGNTVRLQCIYNVLADEDLELIERGNNFLNSNEVYKEKYLTKHDDEDNSPEDEYATIDEMKAEALFRMKDVIEYTDLIDYFEETGLPQVYEPPYGASYSLEEDELKNVRRVESDRQVLVWGVIRCNMMYNKQEVTVDCMLHVSQDKNEWEQEREDLRNGFPFVYTVMKEYPVIDHGHINVYKSKGGTLLRG